MSKIAILTPTVWGNLKFLEDAGKSLAEQTDKDFEWIIAGTTIPDETKTLFEGRKEFGGCPCKIIIAGDRPLYAAKLRNIAAKNSDAQYYGFLDDDDMKYPAFNERMSRSIIESYIGVLCSSRMMRVDGSDAGGGHPTQRLTYPHFFISPGSWILADELMVKSDIFWKIGGFDEEMEASEDFDIVLRLLQIGQLNHIQEDLNKKREVHSSSTSEASDVGGRTGKAMFKIFKRHRDYLYKLCPKCNVQIDYDRVFATDNVSESPSHIHHCGNGKSWGTLCPKCLGIDK